MKLRPYESVDCAALARLFYQTVHTVNARDYTQEQLDAWATEKVDLEAWDRSLRQHCSVVAEEKGEIIGFGDMTPDGYLDRLYVHRDHQRRGVATAICEELERSVHAARFTTHASITARPFFSHRGYRVRREQQVQRQGIWLTNFVMEKDMAKIIAVCGKICSGKTCYAGRLRQQEHAVILSCDELTAALFDNNLGQQHEEMLGRIQGYLLQKAAELVLSGCSVILDWGFWSRTSRRTLMEFCQAQKLACQWHYVAVSENTWHRNIEKRNRSIRDGQNTKDCYLDEGLLQKLMVMWEAPNEEEIDIWFQPEEEGETGDGNSEISGTGSTGDDSDLE